MLNYLIQLAEKSMLPDILIRIGIRSLCYKRLEFIKNQTPDELEAHHQEWIDKLKISPIALVPDKANKQHYEVPSAFFELVLGKQLKYSSGFWPHKINSLDKSENAMLKLTIERSQLKDGMDILELGCGWGSLTTLLASNYPNSQITAVSNSSTQRQYIENKCEQLKYSNVSIITADMNDFKINKKFDRIVSVEMFEHMRNYEKLLNKCYNLLNDQGKLFVHIFSHKSLIYPFENGGPGDWMAREFFSGGIMPSHKMLLHFQNDLKIQTVWRISGKHYSKTSLAWLNKMDKNKSLILEIFNDTYGPNQAKIWFQRWRIFFMSCQELFGINNGTEWGVSHYLFKK